MASDLIRERLHAEFDAAPGHIDAVTALLEAGANAQYIARYRRDEAGDLGEERVLAIEERLHFLLDLERRKEGIWQQAEAKGAADPALRRVLDHCVDQDQLDDVLQSLKPRRRGEALRAEEAGLGPLALAIRHRTLEKGLAEAAAEYVNPERGLSSVETVLEGTAVLLAEHFASDAQTRAQIREELSRGMLRATAVAPDRKDAQRYKDFFGFEQPIRRVPANRMLALRRAEREGIVRLELCLPEGRELQIFRKRFDPKRPQLPDGEAPVAGSSEPAVAEPAVETPDIQPAVDAAPADPAPEAVAAEGAAPPAAEAPAEPAAGSPAEPSTETSAEAPAADTPRPEGGVAKAAARPAVPPAQEPVGEFLDLVFKHAYETFVRPACQADILRRIKEKVDRETVRAFARNLRSQLLSPPLGPKKALAVRASSQNAWFVILAEDGSIAQKTTVALNQEGAKEGATAMLRELIQKEQPAGIAVPHGRRQDASDHLVQAAVAGLDPRPMVIPVDEAASAIYATSAAGRKALPGLEVGMRTTVSLGRRLQDPLHELVQMDPRSLSLGSSLGEVHQGLLQRTLDAVISSCVARVGTDVNRADAEALARVPGITREIARAIVKQRQDQFGFKNLVELEKVPGLDPERTRWFVGFLRLYGGEEPLDATGIHPENYELARRVAQQVGVAPTELAGRNLRSVDIQPFLQEGMGRLRVLDALHALAHQGQDPRGALSETTNQGVATFADLKVDQELRGRVTNLTEFGAFVDLGIGHDGLVHISQIPPNRLRNPDQMLRVGEVVHVFVTHLDAESRKISLSMHRPRHVTEQRAPTIGERMDRAIGRAGQARRRREEPRTEVLSRVARPPEGRRGDRRRGPRTDTRDGGGGSPAGGDRSPFQGGDRRRDRDRERAPAGEPRVFTVESEKANGAEEKKGFKGEFRSLAGLKALLAKKDEPEPKAEG
ncbi:MAG: S1 RNA-binding domain-containing protein [Planctomycetes bacterium]|nr:S1 RNA-binding domain-containing protein [Planctomycetota bacterium]